MRKIILLSFLSLGLNASFAQSTPYWQQHADYKMEVSMDVKNYQYKGKQELVYTNNSPDTLRKVFYHLFPNAFQPGSEMDARLHFIKDPDGRMVNKVKTADGKEVKQSRIESLKPNEIGYLKISDFKQDGISAQTRVSGTILEVILPKPILPNSKTTFTLGFDGQVPVQIRRSGRNNSEGVELSMSQWYPKLAEFDFEGWHADPYIAREFHGVWGNFDVKITIDKDYTIGGSGYLQDKNTIGHGYEDAGVTVVYPKKAKTLTWHFIAPNVHDFTWAADKEYTHDIVKGPNGVDLHFFYKNNEKTTANWKQLEPLMVKVMDYYNHRVGAYPYKQYSFIQGGDGGMEYAMCTLMLGNGTLEGILGTATHELGHSWFQHILASNESKHPWMDEGFTTYIEDSALNELKGDKKEANPFKGTYAAYYSLVNSGKEQPQTTHGDRYDENRPYSISSYVKGCIFLAQLEYVIGKESLDATLKRYFNDFKFKHPTPNDIKRTAERVSGAELDWYLIDWAQTANTIDYGIKDVADNSGKTTISLERIGRMPMPIDLKVDYTDGTSENFYIPLRMMNFIKPNPNPNEKRTVLEDWAWAMSNYSFTIDKNKTAIKKITIDPSGLMADVKPANNVFEVK
ncbi:M1 family peptidase [Flavobacterium sp. WLB]|uniref:M1 family metallopeptidase n=1 Tax=Flavobacterium TaxID=237 RepID=UPI0006ABCCC9|nr:MULTISPECIES: M1 family metallopeptidase [Flavobacterium]KOP37172.1 peptidase M1 [Flavobacterium sp. VMW]OWU90898.1 peptidase M1 [Flavobacterium sp. NLM]PUU70866.1 M1 family peptidase [Flavobacterium sp. WLB]UUF15745.1 M1 family metallopeptidase [Flavobacterium panici]